MILYIMIIIYYDTMYILYYLYWIRYYALRILGMLPRIPLDLGKSGMPTKLIHEWIWPGIPLEKIYDYNMYTCSIIYQFKFQPCGFHWKSPKVQIGQCSTVYMIICNLLPGLSMYFFDPKIHMILGCRNTLKFDGYHEYMNR